MDSHKSFIYIKDSLERQFYMEMCRIEHWDTRTLDEKIDSQFYQRTAISQRPEEVIKRELDELRDADMLNHSCCPILHRTSFEGNLGRQIATCHCNSQGTSY